MLGTPFQGIMVLVAMVFVVWGIFDLMIGTTTTLPGRFMPKMEFNREEDGLIFYIVCGSKFLIAFSMVGWGFGWL